MPRSSLSLPIDKKYHASRITHHEPLGLMPNIAELLMSERRLSNRRYKYIIFDVGGTLLRWDDPPAFARFLADYAKNVSPEQIAADAAALRQLMIETFARHRHAAVGMGAKEEILVRLWREVLKETLELWKRPGYSEDLLEPLITAVVLGQFDALFDDALETLERLRAAGYRLGIISNWNENLPQELSRLGLDRYFDFVVVSSLVGVAKPSPEIFRIGLARAGCQPEEALYVGDNVMDDCLGARRAGLDVALIHRHGEAKTAQLLCTAVYPSLTALANALLEKGG